MNSPENDSPQEHLQEFAHILLPGESIIDIEKIPQSEPTRDPSALRELYRLARRDKLGKFNPPWASLALENEKDESENLHLYEALFGRDSLRVAVDVLPAYPELTRATILALAGDQGVESNIYREEEPGRIPHEVRDASDPIATRITKELGWQWPYYGSIDATPEYIRTIAQYCAEVPNGVSFLDEQFIHHQTGERVSVKDSFDQAVDWLVGRLDSNAEGLLEYKTAIPKGIENQSWKDSWDSYFHKDGTMANHEQGIASIEVQRVAYDALLDAAELSQDPAKEKEFLDRAEKLKSTILTEFWVDDDGGYFALGTDRDEAGALRKLKTKTSNMGHLLHSRLLTGDDPKLKKYREAIVRQVMSPAMRTNYGIRTLANDEVRYRPAAYHNGSIWLWDTHVIAQGLRNHGYNSLADTIDIGLLNTINESKAFPEYIRGDSIDEPLLNTEVVDIWDEAYQRTNRLEQPPQMIQAWSVAAALSIKLRNGSRHEPAEPIDEFEREILASIQ